MIVVAIIGLIAAMGVPSILQTFRKEGMRKAVSDVHGIAERRARAGDFSAADPPQIVFYPAEKRLEIADAPSVNHAAAEHHEQFRTTPSPAVR